MKMLIAWLTLTGLVFAASAGGYHAYLDANPRHLAVVIDTSFDMRTALSHAKRVAQQFETEHRYTRFGLYTEKARVHTFAPTVRASTLNAYGPRTFERLLSGPLADELNDADEVVLISNAPVAELDTLPSRWRRLAPDLR